MKLIWGLRLIWMVFLAFAIGYRVGKNHCVTQQVFITTRPPVPPDLEGKPFSGGWIINCVAVDGTTMVVQPNYAEPRCWWPEAGGK